MTGRLESQSLEVTSISTTDATPRLHSIVIEVSSIEDLGGAPGGGDGSSNRLGLGLTPRLGL